MALVSELTARRLEVLLAAEQRQGRVPSLAAAITRNQSLAWRGYAGEQTGSRGGRPTDLQYRIGSITKTMTAVLVMQLRDLGKLSLDDPLSTYLPVGRHGSLTLRSLLAHHSGIPAEPAGPWWERNPGGTIEELIENFTRVEPSLAPGTTYHYSNLAYGLLGEVVAQVRGRSWWECITEHLLQPLGMLRTSYDPFEPHARGYSVDPFVATLMPEPSHDTGAMAPAGQVWSTVLDLATYADFLIAGSREVLSRETLAEMATPQVGTAADGLGSGYGLGLRLTPGGSGTLVGHTGSMPGFQATLFVDRVRRTGAVVLGNSTTGLRPDEIGPGLLAVLEEAEPTLVDPWLPTTIVPDLVSEVVGVWHWGNTAHVFTWDGLLLHASHLHTGAHRHAYRLDGETFIGVEGYHLGERLNVVRRGDGSISHLECATFIYTRTPYGITGPG